MTEKIANIQKVVKELLEEPYQYAKKVSIEKLANILRQLSYHYYNTDEELVPDEIFDVLKNVLEERDPANSFLTEVGAPISKDRVELPYFMPSLDKIKPATNEIQKWKGKYDGPYVLSDKLDGVSGLLVRKRKNLKLYTRGNGKEGQDISYLIPYIMPELEVTDLPEGSAVRGELIITKKNFKKFKGKFANARNTVAGLVNSKNYSLDVAKLTDFVCYSVINPRHKQTQQMEMLKKWDLDVVEYKIRKEISNEFLSDYLTERRERGDYEVDGIVVIDGGDVYDLEDKNPEYGFAFKTVLTDQVAEATVLEVEWSVSKDGYLKPRVKIDPVKLVGVTITYATAFNAKFVKDNKLGPGAVVKLVRSGDVIPHIMEVIKPSATGEPQMPDIPHKWTKSGVDLIVKDLHGAAQDNIRTKQITYFFKTLGVKHISEATIGKLVDNGYKSVFDILKADLEEMAEIEGIGQTLLKKVFQNIEKAFEKTSLQKLMAASNLFGRGMGEKRIKLILNKYPDILKKKWDVETTKDKVVQIEGFDTITATQFANGLKKFKSWFKKLEGLVDIDHLKVVEKTKKTKGTFQDKKVVFTGFRDKDLETFVETEGGEVTGTVSKNTSLVVFVQPPGKSMSSKLKKAHDLNIDVMTKDEFVSEFIN